MLWDGHSVLSGLYQEAFHQVLYKRSLSGLCCMHCGWNSATNSITKAQVRLVMYLWSF